MEYTKQIRDRIVAAIVCGRALAEIQTLPGMPPFVLMLDWIDDHEDLRTRIEAAQIAYAESLLHCNATMIAGISDLMGEEMSDRERGQILTQILRQVKINQTLALTLIRKYKGKKKVNKPAQVNISTGSPQG